MRSPHTSPLKAATSVDGRARMLRSVSMDSEGKRGSVGGGGSEEGKQANGGDVGVLDEAGENDKLMQDVFETSSVCNESIKLFFSF